MPRYRPNIVTLHLDTNDMNQNYQVLADTLHPNDNGYAKMAAAFDAGIRQALLNGWVADPVPAGPDTCGSSTPGDYRVDFDGDGRADYLALADNGAIEAWANAGGDGRGGWISYGRVATGVGAPGNQVRI